MKLPQLKVTFRQLKVNKVVKFFVLSDFLFCGGWALLSPLFGIFVLQRLNGSSVFTVGLAFALYYFTKAVTEIPISFYLDAHEGEKDDFYAVIIGLCLGGLAPILFLTVKNIIALLIVMMVQGVAFAFYSTAWPTIFSRHLDKNSYSSEWALDHFGIDVTSALMAFLGGGIALYLGFDFVCLFTALASFVSAGILFAVPDLILPKRTLKEPILIDHDHDGPGLGK